MKNSEEKVILLKSVIDNSLALLAVKAFMPITFFAITVSIARLIGVKEFGIFGIIICYYSIFRIVSIFGVDSLILREAPKKEEFDSYLGNAYLLGCITSVTSMLLMNILLYSFGYSSQVRITGFVLSLSLLPDSLTRYNECILIVLRKSWHAFFITFFRESLKIICALAILLIYKSLFGVILAILFSNFIGFILSLLVMAKRFVKPRFNFDKNLLVQAFHVSFILAVISGLSSLFLATDVIVLSKIKGEIAVGFYSAAFKFITFAFLFIDSFGSVLVPILSKFYRDAQDVFRELCEIIVKYLIIGSFIFSLLIYVFSEKIVIAIFGIKFLNSMSILNILIWAVLFLSNSYFLARMLFIVNMQKYDLLALLLSCIVNLALNIPFTIIWGYQGTALATVISTALLFFMHLYFFQKKVFRANVSQTWIKPLICGVLFLVIYFYFARVNRYFSFTFSLLIYFLVLTALKVIKNEEINILFKTVFLRQKACR